MLNVWNRYKKKLCPFTSPLKLVTKIENFPANLKGFVDLLKEKEVARLKDWMIKMRLKDQIIVILQTNKLSLYNYIQLDRRTKEWLKTNGKCRECTKYEQFYHHMKTCRRMI